MPVRGHAALSAYGIPLTLSPVMVSARAMVFTVSVIDEAYHGCRTARQCPAAMMTVVICCGSAANIGNKESRLQKCTTYAYRGTAYWCRRDRGSAAVLFVFTALRISGHMAAQVHKSIGHIWLLGTWSVANDSSTATEGLYGDHR